MSRSKVITQNISIVDFLMTDHSLNVNTIAQRIDNKNGLNVFEVEHPTEGTRTFININQFLAANKSMPKYLYSVLHSNGTVHGWYTKSIVHVEDPTVIAPSFDALVTNPNFSPIQVDAIREMTGKVIERVNKRRAERAKTKSRSHKKAMPIRHPSIAKKLQDVRKKIIQLQKIEKELIDVDATMSRLGVTL